MKSDEGQLVGIMQALRERAKELNCLYRVDDLLNSDPERPLQEVLRGIVEIVPHGWQYVDICKARILLDNVAIEPEGFRPSPWTQSARILVEGEPIGTIEVVYSKTMPHADEGPFLKE